jgi:hypothetical protein
MQAPRPDVKVTRVTLGGNPAERLGMNFTLEGGATRSLGVRLVHKDADSLQLRICDAGNADASGDILVEFGDKHSTRAIFGMGVVDGQPFAVQFSTRPLQMNLNATGRGEWSSPEGGGIPISRVGLLADSSLAVELVFCLSDGSFRRLSGRASQMGSDHPLRIAVSAFRTGGASGELVIKLNQKPRSPRLTATWT